MPAEAPLRISLNSEHLDCADLREELKGKVDKVKCGQGSQWAWEILAESRKDLTVTGLFSQLNLHFSEFAERLPHLGVGWLFQGRCFGEVDSSSK